MKIYLNLSIFLLSFILFGSCNKEEDFNTMIYDAEESTYVCNSIAGLMETAFDIMSYNINVSNTNHDLINDDGSVFFSDNYFFDNNGVACDVSFGKKENGSKGYDDRYKSGMMHIRMSKFYSNLQNKISISFNKPDDLKFHKQVLKNVFVTYNVIGKIEMTRLDDVTWFYETKNLKLSAKEKDLLVELSGYVYLVDGRVEGFLDNNYGLTFNGNFNQKYFIYSSLDKMCTKDFEKDCSQNFQTGEWTLETKTGKIGKLNFDAYNDASCDQFAKLSWKGKEDLIKLN